MIVSRHCDMCAGPLPWKPYRAVVVSRGITCCSLACVERLRAVWAPAPRYPVRSTFVTSAVIALLTLAALV